MSATRSYTPADRQHAGWVRDIERKVATNTATFRYVDGGTVTSTLRAKPRTVRVDSAVLVSGADGTILSGMSIAWRWLGGGDIAVDAIATLSPTAEYDVALELVE